MNYSDIEQLDPPVKGSTASRPAIKVVRRTFAHPVVGVSGLERGGLRKALHSGLIESLSHRDVTLLSSELCQPTQVTEHSERCTTQLCE